VNLWPMKRNGRQCFVTLDEVAALVAMSLSKFEIDLEPANVETLLGPTDENQRCRQGSNRTWDRCRQSWVRPGEAPLQKVWWGRGRGRSHGPGAGDAGAQSGGWKEGGPVGSANEVVSEVGGNFGHIAPMERVGGPAKSEP